MEPATGLETGDLFVTNEVLYRLSYTGKAGGRARIRT